MQTTITRQQLKQIHDIACEGWKKKLSEYAAKDPFSESITFTEQQVQQMLDAATKEQLPTVKEIFQVKDITSKIKTLQDAINYLGEEDEEVTQLRLLYSIKGLERRVIAQQELVVITKALNEKKVLNWDDSSEYKYIPWFSLGAAFRLSCVGCLVSGSGASVRLLLVKKELAEYAAEQFKELYKEYLN